MTLQLKATPDKGAVQFTTQLTLIIEKLYEMVS